MKTCFRCNAPQPLSEFYHFARHVEINRERRAKRFKEAAENSDPDSALHAVA